MCEFNTPIVEQNELEPQPNLYRISLHYTSHTGTGTNLIGSLASTESQLPAIQAVLANSPEIFEFIKKGTFISVTVGPAPANNHPNEKTILELIAEQKPGKRIPQLRETAGLISKEVENSCSQMLTENIEEMVESNSSEFNWDRPDVKAIELLMDMCFEEAFANAVSALGKDTIKLNTINTMINGKLTYTEEIETLAVENSPLVPRIFIAIIMQVMEQTDWELGETVEKLIDFGAENLNSLIYMLRIGNNGSMRSYKAVSSSLIINTTGETLDISLDPIALVTKIKAATDRNKFNEEFRANLVKFSEVLKQQGMTLRFPEENFGFRYGSGGICPVPGGAPYEQQCQLAFRILEVAQHYIKNA